MFKYNDVHIHVKMGSPILGQAYDFDTLKLKKSISNIDNGIIFLYPLISNLYKCKPRHIISVTSFGDRGCCFSCTDCGKVLYRGSDPFHADNELLINKCKNTKGLFPFIYLTLNNNTFLDEFEYFVDNYDGLFHGIKIHPNLMQTKIETLNFNSNIPIIVHCGTNKYDNPRGAVDFAKGYNGAVLLAHWARFDEDTLYEVRKNDNLFVDCSPNYSLEQIITGKQSNRWLLSPAANKESVSELFKYIIGIIGNEKIIYGSDTPWGDIFAAEAFASSLKTDSDTLHKIFETNFYSFLNFSKA